MSEAITIARENERLLALNADLRQQLDDWRDAHSVVHTAHRALFQQVRELSAAWLEWRRAVKADRPDDIVYFEDFGRLMDAASEGFDGD